MEIWINPACSKCRTALETLDGAGVPYEVRRYLETPPTRPELTAVLERLGQEPWDVARLNDPLAQSVGLGALPKEPARRDEWIDVLVSNPSLIQRPILTTRGGRSFIGRSPQALEEAIRAERG